MQELPKLHRNYSSGAIIRGSVHPTEDNILLLNNIDMYNYTAVSPLYIRVILILIQPFKHAVPSGFLIHL